MFRKPTARALVFPFLIIVLALFFIISVLRLSVPRGSAFPTNIASETSIAFPATRTATRISLKPMAQVKVPSVTPRSSPAQPTKIAFPVTETVTPGTVKPPVQATAPPVQPGSGPQSLTRGLHLLVDEYWIESAKNITRQVMHPSRITTDPIVSGTPGLGAWQPWVTVLHDPPTNKFRMWYNAFDANSEAAVPSQLAYLESPDGIQWAGPPRILGSIPLLGASIIDEGLGYSPPDRRFKLVYWQDPRPSPTSKPGMKVAYSPDGLEWTLSPSAPFSSDTVPEDDIWNVFFDPRYDRYGVLFKQFRPYTWKDSSREKVQSYVRLVGYSTSKNFEEWSKPRTIFAPDTKDQGITQWYGVGGVQRRGDLLIGFLKVLRDDLTAPGAPPGARVANPSGQGGTGWTTLAWQRNETGWDRDRAAEKFFEPNPEIGAWDHAVTWIDSAVQVGEYLYLYYGGYRWGHKYNQTTDRQIGLARIKVDRFVARSANNEGGTLRTRLLTFDAARISLNVNAVGGLVKFQILDAAGEPIPGFSFADCQPITVDSLSVPITCKGSLKALANTPVHFEFDMKHAQLFALDLN